MLTLIGVPASSLHASAMRIRHTTADPESSMFADLEPLLILLLITTVQCVATSPQLPQAPYELAFSTFGVVTQQSGLIEMVCRNESTAEKLPVNDINIWLNRTLVDDRDLREREDVGIVEVHGCCRLRFNLTHQLGGHYTCGKRIDAANVKESPAKTLNSFRVIFPLMAAVQTTYTATAGDRIVLQCPIQPGALLEYYSVKWMKGNVPIAKARNPYDISTVNSRYSIDATSYSLAIDDVGLNDSSTYRCDLFATIPATKARRRLRFNQDRDILLSLRVLEKPSISSGPSNIVECNPLEQPSFSCVAIGPNAPNITWTYISNGGEEVNLTDGDNYQIESNVSMVEGGLYAINTTLTFLNVAANESAIVKCKIDVPGAVSSEALLVTINCSNNTNDVTLSVELLALVVSLIAAIGIGLILIIVTCVYCMHTHQQKSAKNFETV